MSLDVWLTVGKDKRYSVFDYNITHNLADMASKAGLHKALWRPEEIGASKAGELVKPLRKGLKLLKKKPELFKKLNPENGWGDYDGLVEFVEKYLDVCENVPEADINISR